MIKRCMHSLYFVIKSDDSKYPRVVMARVSGLLDDEDFVSSDGYWRGGKCDWYAIGGRWSGLLSRLTWAKEAIIEIGKLEEKSGVEIIGVYYGRKGKRAKQQEIAEQAEKIWNKYKPEEYQDTTYFRDSLAMSSKGKTPQDDDAMIITPELWKNLKAEYANVEVFIADEYEEAAIGNFDEEEVIGKWITVVDYHI